MKQKEPTEKAAKIIMLFKKNLGIICIGLNIAVLTYFATAKSIGDDPKTWTGVIIVCSLIVFFILFLILYYSKEKFSQILEKIDDDIKKNKNALDGETEEEATKIVSISENIYNKRRELWKKSGDDINVNNLLRSLVYPGSSIYSVTAFIIGKDPETGEPTDMLLMRAQKKENKPTPPTYQEFDVLGERMPPNAIPHKYAKWLIFKYVENYPSEKIEFSEHFHKVDFPDKDGKIDDFTYQVPLPFKVQEESNAQSDGSPFFLDFNYVLEVTKDGPRGILQTDLKAEWVKLEEVLEICGNGASPPRYGGLNEKGKEYLKFWSQVFYAKKIAEKYLEINKK